MRGENISSIVMGSNTVLLVVIGIFLTVLMNPISNPRYMSGTAILSVATAFGLFATRSVSALPRAGFWPGCS